MAKDNLIKKTSDLIGLSKTPTKLPDIKEKTAKDKKNINNRRLVKAVK